VGRVTGTNPQHRFERLRLPKPTLEEWAQLKSLAEAEASKEIVEYSAFLNW